MIAAAFAMVAALAARAAPPAYDHVVVVIEENKSVQIIGNTVDAPYLTSLAAGGVSFTNFFALTHPSQPNYIELFSGANQNVTGNGTPAGIPFSTPNLGAAMLAAQRTFKCYSENLPQGGGGADAYPYARRHNPWVNWIDATLPTPTNRLPPSIHRPFTEFPTDFNTLPHLAFVVPNELNNMHDGTVRMGDDWLAANMSAYAEWAKTHNSLLIITWDEDDGLSGGTPNRIPTVLYGAHLQPGPNAVTWTLHNLQRTIEDIFGIAHSGVTSMLPPISGVFTGDLPQATATFQQGLNGYSGADDTQLRQAMPDTVYGAFGSINVGGGADQKHTLVRFSSLFGGGASQVPIGAPIISAKLLIMTASSAPDSAFVPVKFHRMITDWSESTATWNSTVAGISADGVEARVAPDFALLPSVTGAPAIFDATTGVQDWAGGGTNRGWALLPTVESADVWLFRTSEEATVASRPALEITYATGSALEFSTSNFEVNETGGMATITVTRTGWLGGSVSVNYATSNGSALASSDYTSASGMLSWGNNDGTARNFTVPITNDGVVEADETLALTLSTPTGSAVLTARSTATLRIKETAFNNWRVSKFGVNANGAIALATADPDDDDLDNYFEFAADAEPLDGQSRGSSLVPASDFLTLTFKRNTAVPDVTFTVQVSGNLPSWDNGSTYAPGGNTPSNAFTTEISRTGSPIETIVVRDNVPISSSPPRRVIRLRMTQP